jgi:23S rRNA (uracil1939-C5)-methyltransferase
MIEKNDIVTLDVERYGAGSEGVCLLDGMAVFVPRALPGETISAQIVKVDKQYAFARLLQVLKKSPLRIEPLCPYFTRCGGCACQHMAYDETLRFKRDKVSGCMTHIGGLDIPVPPVIPMENPWHYRNKTALPVGGNSILPEIGFYAPRSHRLVPIDQCLIAKPESDMIAEAVKNWMRKYQIRPYDEITHTGLVRHVMTRVSRDGKAMAVIVANSHGIPREEELVCELRAALPGLYSVYLSENTAPGNVILGSGYRILWGADRLPDSLSGLSFLLSPLSFFQVNPVQTEILYAIALKFASLQKSETAVDLYCGAGAISMLLARNAAKVIGVDIIPDAIRDATENTARNGTANVDFICGAAEVVLPRLISDGCQPDVIVLDPPRKGADAVVLAAVAAARPSRIVYISCDPATQARDAKTLCGMGYRVAGCQSVDMFCWTDSVENILLFTTV